MFIAGTNFVLSYYIAKGKFKKAAQDEEFKTYLFGIIALTLVTTFFIYFFADVSETPTVTQLIAHPMVNGELESAFRHALFQVLSVITTTGFVTADYDTWPSLSTMNCTTTVPERPSSWSSSMLRSISRVTNFCQALPPPGNSAASTFWSTMPA